MAKILGDTQVQIIKTVVMVELFLYKEMKTTQLYAAEH